MATLKRRTLIWEYGWRPVALKVLGKIENLFITSGCKTFTFEKTLEDALDKTDVIIKKHKEHKGEEWKKVSDRLEKNVEKIKAQFEGRGNNAETELLNCGELKFNRETGDFVPWNNAW